MRVEVVVVTERAAGMVVVVTTVSDLESAVAVSKMDVVRSEVDGCVVDEMERAAAAVVVEVLVLVLVLVLVVGTEIFMGSVFRLRTSRIPVQVTLPQS